MEEHQGLFRKKTLDRISSPEQLNDHLRVTNPGVWLVLAIVILLLGALFAWASIGTLETTQSVKVVINDHEAQVLSLGDAPIAEGMTLRISGQADTTIAFATQDEYGRSIGMAEAMLPDGIYDGLVVTDTMRPIEFLLNNR